MPDSEKPAGAPGSGDPQTRDDVRAKVVREFQEKCTNPDGSFNEEAAAELFWLRDEKLHETRKEAKERRLREEQNARDLADREAKIKAAEEAKALEEKRYLDVIESQKAELASAKARLAEMDRLEGIVKSVNERQKEEVTREFNTLGEPDRALFNDFAAALPPDSYDQQLAFVRKLRERGGAPAGGTTPEGAPLPVAQGGRPGDGGSAAGMSTEEWAALKKNNPELYRARLIELHAAK